VKSVEEKIKRLKMWLNNKVGPFLIEVWPTNRCNLRCIMCGTWANRRKLEEKGIRYNPTEEMKNEIPEERLLLLIEEAKELEAKEFLITGGGEPFVRKDVTLKLMRKIKDMEMFGNLNTNGTLLTEEDICKIVKIGWDMVMFSIDAPDSEIHDQIRGMKGCFERVKKNLLVLNKVKKNLKTDKPRVVFNTVLNNKVYNKIDELTEFASQVGCEDITFIPLIPYDNFARKIELSKYQKVKLEKDLDRLISFSRKLGINTNLNELSFSTPSGEMDETILSELEGSSRDLIHSPCFEPFLHFLVKADGEATFCCMIENSPDNIKEKSLRQIWFGEYFTEQRKNFINRKIRKECRLCVFSQFIRNKEIREELSKHL
jgi:MoaA/NifB/PqqE/SkfB family radical SAM enzyme